MFIETVKIVATNPEEQGSFIIINKSDFDDKTMKLYDEKADKNPKLPLALVEELADEKGAE